MKWKYLLYIIFCIFIGNLFFLNHTNHDYYAKLLEEKMERIVLGESAPRGKILDRNGVVLVDNKNVLNIVYHRPNKISLEEELEVAQKLSLFVEKPFITTTDLKNYYLAKNNNGNDLITKEEWNLWDERKLNNDDIKKLKWDRITEVDITYSLEEQKVIDIFSKMQKGYIYEDKYLFSKVSEEFLNEVLNLNIPSISLKITTERTYPYESVLRSIFGSVGSIPREDLELYLKKNYKLADIVGTSGLEKEYESILKGEKAKYYVNSDNSLTLLEEAKQGSDLVLNLDISFQLELESVMKSEMLNAKKSETAKYFHEAYAMIGDPKTGGILAISGLKNNQDQFEDITITAFSSSFAMGSVVKGASNTVGYMSGGIQVGKRIYDSCVKLWSEPQKCSYMKLGYVDDITALRTSSNYFQFLTAIQSTGQSYVYNMKFNVTENDFNRYRDVFASYGLGAKTEIDYPNEQVGMKGSKIAGDLLLNFAIGQYDTYTPISLLQYINTIANYGNRYALRLKKEKYNTFLNQVELDSTYYDRIIEGLYQVFHGGTATSYVKSQLNAVGKTGTSETFYDSDHDGLVDKEVINTTVIFYYPRENPTYSMAIVAPYITDDGDYQYPFTRNVSFKMTEFLPL